MKNTIEFLGNTFNLDMLNEQVENSNRLPRILLFRQVYWGQGEERRVGTDVFLEVMFCAGIGKISKSEALYYSSKMANEDHHNKWTAVELMWLGEETTTPHVMDVIEFFPDGTRKDDTDRRRERVKEQREQAQREQKASQ